MSKIAKNYVAFSQKLIFSYSFDYLKKIQSFEKLSTKVKMRLLRIFVFISF